MGLGLTDELLVLHDARIELDAHRLRVVRRARAHRLVVGVLRALLAPGVADCRLEDALVLLGREVLEEDVFDAPEASRGKRRDFGRSAACGSASPSAPMRAQ